VCIPKDQKREILVVSENGYGKRSDLEDYRVTNRGGKGVKTINITEKTGNLIAVRDVNDGDDLMIINKSGIIIRMAIADLRVVGRATQGVRLIKITEGDAIAAVAKVDVEAGAEPDEVISQEPEEKDEDQTGETDNLSENNEN
jgi:DNA gyrase subunit A